MGVPKTQRRKWPLKDEEYLEDAWGKLSKVQIQAHLPRRTWEAIEEKARNRRLRINDNATILTLTAVKEIMGLERRFKVLGWVKRGQLKAVKSDWGDSKSRRYITTETDLVNFLKRCQGEYDLALIDHPYYKKIAQDVKSHLSPQEVQYKYHIPSKKVCRYISRGLITATAVSHSQYHRYQIPVAEVEVLNSFFKNYPDLKCKCGFNMSLVRLNSQIKRVCLKCETCGEVRKSIRQFVEKRKRRCSTNPIKRSL